MSKRKQKTLLGYFKCSPSIAAGVNCSTEENQHVANETPEKRKRDDSEDNVNEVLLDSLLPQTPQNLVEGTSNLQQQKDLENIPTNDIGNWVGRSSIMTDEQRMDMLHRCWKPPDNYNYAMDATNLKRKFKHSWLEEYSPWLQYSKKLKGPFCLYCVLFPPKVIHGVLGSLIIRPFLKYKKMNEHCRAHAVGQYHKASADAARVFTKNVPVNILLDKSHRQETEENKRIVSSIIDCVIFCGTHDMPLRGDGLHEGVFYDLIEMRIDSGDETLKQHLVKGKKNAQYLSPQIQNQIIHICGNVLRSEIVEQLKETSAFSILADESADISGKEQLSIGVRFFDTKRWEVREEFLGFVELVSMDANAIALAISEFFSSISVDSEKCVGQGYDGCSTMAGKDAGVQKLLREKFRKALYFHCASHKLNLVVNDLNTVVEVRNTISTIKDIIRFFRESTIRRRHAPNLPPFCETRWSQKYKSIAVFKQHFIGIVESLQKLSQEGNSATRATAFQLHCASTRSIFIFCLCVIARYSAVLEPVVNSLQSKNMNLLKCSQHIDRVISLVEHHRELAEDQVKEIFKDVMELSDALGIDLQLPRIAKKQQHRTNVPATSLCEHFRRSIYIPYMDSLKSSLESRFSPNNSVAYSLNLLHPAKFLEMTGQEIREKSKDFCDTYNLNLESEIELWENLWKEKKMEKEALEELDLTDILKEADDFFPQIKQALLILLSLPCTTATIERTFSTLRRVKTWLRSTMVENRLNGLCMLSVHRKMVLNNKKTFKEKVFEIFCEQKRRLHFK